MCIKTDSRKVTKGDTFIALRSIHDGHLYVEDAINNGAIEVIVEEGSYSVKTTVVPNTRDYLIDYLNEQYSDRINKLKIIGMTGTNGKTTTCYLIYKTLNKLGIKCAYIGTIGFYMDKKVGDLNNTTPDVLDIYNMLIECLDNNYMYVVMEVSSHAIDMKRIGHVTFDYAIFSNLTKDHLDYHKTMEAYAKVKQKLFTKLKPNGKVIVNIDDEYKNYFLLDNDNITYGFKESDYQVIDYKISTINTIFHIKKNDQIKTFTTKLIGKHNIYNLLCVIIILYEQGFNDEEIKNCICDLTAPIGRMETITYGTNQIIIDYAHTPDATLNVLKAVSELKPNHIYTVIGCGGDRDKTKRPEMANIATTNSDYVIFTSDNPRTEKATDIIDDMIKNINNKNYEIEVNREKAIIKGVQLLRENDILMVLGKGHETYQIIGVTKNPFDDKKIVEDNI